MTEMTTVVSMLAGDQQHGPLGSGGRLLPGIEARIVRPNGSTAAPGESGELYVRGPAAALGYWGNPSAWVRTGDQVLLTEDQEVFVQDRLKEFIKVKGFQVAPAELEGTLLGHPDVLDCCVVGIQDEQRGEAPLAYVVLSHDAQDSKEHPKGERVDDPPPGQN
ncbi:4-coumarate--CoA ligase-like 7 [Leucoagaricus sp. SymC.cos]|nr:4-coumarate--CoA ligase-like 7 [Leucoagaricus sp. SymC.cos]